MGKTSCKPAVVLVPAALTLAGGLGRPADRPSFPGGVGGWLYYRYVGCAAGACAITSNP